MPNHSLLLRHRYRRLCGLPLPAEKVRSIRSFPPSASLLTRLQGEDERGDRLELYQPRQLPILRFYSSKRITTLDDLGTRHSIREPSVLDKDFSEVQNARDEITRLLSDTKQYQPGSLTPELIQKAEDAIELWVFERTKEAYENSSKILRRLLLEQEFFKDSQTSEHGKRFFIRPFLLHRVIDCWRKGWINETLDIIPEEIISHIEEFEARGLIPDNKTLSMVVNGIINRGDPIEAPLLCQWLLDRRLDQAAEDPTFRPDSVLISYVMLAWAKSKRNESTEMVEGLLKLMQSFEENGWTESAPTTLSYVATIRAWFMSRHPDANRRIEELLEQMRNSYGDRVKPSRMAFVYAIEHLVTSKSPGGSQQAYDLLQEMIQLSLSGYEDVKPIVSDFSRVMYSYALEADVDKVEELFRELNDFSSTIGDPDYEPDNECFKAKLLALAKSGAAWEAQEILDNLVEQALSSTKGSNVNIMPKRSYFVEVLVAWTKQFPRSAKASEQAENVLLRLLDLSKSGYPDLAPAAKSFEKVMDCWSKTKGYNTAAERATSLLHTMDRTYNETGDRRLKPSTKAFDFVLVAWSYSGQSEAPEKAEEMIREMERRYVLGDTHCKPSRGSYTSLMLTWLRSRRKNALANIQRIFEEMEARSSAGDSSLVPDAAMYTILMEALANLGDANKAEALLDRMLDAHKKGNEEAKPDTRVLNTLLKACNRSRGKHKKVGKVESIYQRMEQMKLTPDGYTYNEMIHAWSSVRGDPKAAERAQYYLERLKQHGRPTVTSYRTVIDAWIRSKYSRASERSEKLLDELLTAVRLKKVPHPDFWAYVKFLKSIEKSRIPRRSGQAKELLKTLPKGKVPRDLLPPI